MDTIALEPEFRSQVDDFIQQRVSEGFATKDQIIE